MLERAGDKLYEDSGSHYIREILWDRVVRGIPGQPSKVKDTQYSVMAYMGKESKKEWIYVYV